MEESPVVCISPQASKVVEGCTAPSGPTAQGTKGVHLPSSRAPNRQCGVWQTVCVDPCLLRKTTLQPNGHAALQRTGASSANASSSYGSLAANAPLNGNCVVPCSSWPTAARNARWTRCGWQPAIVGLGLVLVQKPCPCHRCAHGACSGEDQSQKH